MCGLAKHKIKTPPHTSLVPSSPVTHTAFFPPLLLLSCLISGRDSNHCYFNQSVLLLFDSQAPSQREEEDATNLTAFGLLKGTRFRHGSRCRLLRQ
ncbi:hypothetical protein GQ602_003517 [Ophiocordyceps camponoti-floridani]|uniref:Uncharacterized protein n=1 Tax=Ophiocordyceps camponoti-floridani TaxID=2030778 RepID=A0A8H4Q8C4_9HYPO|nr:hypothetical protein GQ602_003517 [Ophiocordyceps camponoti-floridani]